MDEFDSIARLFRPLATSPEALGLMDDAAVLAPRQGHDLVVTADAMVEGIHFLPDDAADLVAKKLLRVNLSDLAAKAAEPYGYVLTVAWSQAWDESRRTAFARGLGEDQTAFGLRLFGGDTVFTPGPMTASVTMFGWVEAGRMIRRSGPRVGDAMLVSGTIGDGYLGLKAARGELDFPADDLAWLAGRYRLPEPRTALRQALRSHATAGADVSDGLLADAGHIGEASGLGVEVELERTPLSGPAAIFLNSAHPRDPEGGASQRGDPGSFTWTNQRGLSLGPRLRGDERQERAMLALATGGDDYEIVCTAPPDRVAPFIKAASSAGVPLTVIGRMVEGQGVSATFHGEPVLLDQLGWRHG